MTRTPRRILAALLGATLLSGVAACVTESKPDEIGLYYTTGSVEGTAFQECIEPSTKGPGTVNDQVFTLPTSLRTYNIRPEGGDTDKPITAGSKPDDKGLAGPQVHVWATTEFYLNTNCGDGKDKNSPIVQFWEKTGRRYKVANPDSGAFDEAGWKNMLLNTLVPVIEKQVQTATRNYAADELDSNLPAKEKGNTPTWTAVEQDLSAGFTEALNEKLGGSYFCGPSYNRAKSDCPAVRVSITDINYADAGLQQARANVRKAEEEAKKRLVDAQAQVDEAAILSKAARDPNYMELKRLEADVQRAQIQLDAAKACAANPNCTVVVGVTGGVNVATK